MSPWSLQAVLSGPSQKVRIAVRLFQKRVAASEDDRRGESATPEPPDSTRLSAVVQQRVLEATTSMQNPDTMSVAESGG